MIARGLPQEEEVVKDLNYYIASLFMVVKHENLMESEINITIGSMYLEEKCCSMQFLQLL